MTKLALQKFTPEDLPLYQQLVGNADVMAMITERAIPAEEAAHDFHAALDNNALHPDFGIFKILDADSGGFIGLAKLEVKAADSAEAELGYMLLPDYWGKGIGSQVASLLTDAARRQAQLQALFAIIDPANIPSRKILERHGFTHAEYRDFDGLPGEILRLHLNRPKPPHNRQTS